MAGRRVSTRRLRDPSSSAILSEPLSDVALAAISPYKKQEEVDNFITFVAEALRKNTQWLDETLVKIPDFKCVMMTGAGPNRFELHEQVYPAEEDSINFTVQMRESEDHDKIALAAVLKLSNTSLQNLIKYLGTNMMDNYALKDALYKGKKIGISYAVLKPTSDTQYRVVEKIPLGLPEKLTEPLKKKRRESPLHEQMVRKAKRVV